MTDLGHQEAILACEKLIQAIRDDMNYCESDTKCQKVVKTYFEALDDILNRTLLSSHYNEDRAIAIDGMYVNPHGDWADYYNSEFYKQLQLIKNKL